MHQVRDGQQVAVTCPACECRLQHIENEFYSGYTHFSSPDKTIYADGRGHTCKFMGVFWFLRDGQYMGAHTWSRFTQWIPPISTTVPYLNDPT